MIRAARAAGPVLLAAVAVMAGCKSGTEQGPFEPDIASMTVTIDGTSYQGSAANNGFGNQVGIVSGQSAVSAIFFRPSGSQELNLTTTDFEFRAVANEVGDPLPAGMWEQSGAFSGTFAGLSEGQDYQIYVGLYHKTQSHWDFGPYLLNVRFPVPTGGGGGGGNPK